MNDRFDAFNSNSGGMFKEEVNDVSGAAQYCGADGCGKTDDIASLSGVTGILPSVLMVTALALVESCLGIATLTTFSHCYQTAACRREPY